MSGWNMAGFGPRDHDAAFDRLPEFGDPKRCECGHYCVEGRVTNEGATFTCCLCINADASLVDEAWAIPECPVCRRRK